MCTAFQSLAAFALRHRGRGNGFLCPRAVRISACPTSHAVLSFLRFLCVAVIILTSALGTSLLPAAASPQTYTISPGGTTIQAAVDAASSGDTIILTDGTYTGPGNVDVDFFGKNLTVTSQNGPTKTIIDCQGSTSANHRGFSIDFGETNAVISGLTIENGYVSGFYGGGIEVDSSNATIQNCIFKNNTVGPFTSDDSDSISGGGGIGITTYNSDNSLEGTVTVRDCTFTGNSATGQGGCGGGIYNGEGVTGLTTVTISDCNFTGNSCTLLGGGVENSIGNISTTTISNCTFNNNSAGYGGGIDNDTFGGGAIVVTDCTIDGNTAFDVGGGVTNEADNLGGTVKLTNCIVNENMAALGSGGGIYNASGAGGNITTTGCTVNYNNNSGGGGGGIYNDIGDGGGTIEVTDSSFTGNLGTDGGGIYNFEDISSNGTINVTGCTLTLNTSNAVGGIDNYNPGTGTIAVTNCTLDDNTAQSYGAIYAQNDGSGFITQTNDILYGDTGGEFISTGATPANVTVNHCDIQGGYAGIGNINADPLFVNAPNDLHLTAASPCIGKGTHNGAPLTDKDGVAFNNPPSIGAYEFHPAAKPASNTVLSVSSSAVLVGQSVTLTATVSGVGGIPSGTVAFYDGTSLLGTRTLAQAGGNATASYPTAALALGLHTFKAVYSGGGTFAGSTSAGVSVMVNNPVPTLKQLSPVSAVVGSGAFTLTLTGTGFIASTQVHFGVHVLTPIPGTLTATQLSVAIPAADITVQGTVGVYVVNPAPGGGTSNTLVFTVTHPDTTPPTTSLTGGPPDTSTSCAATVTFTFTGSDNVTPVSALRYETSLDGAPFSAPSSATSKTLSGLTQGAHVFIVKAVDQAGNVDLTGATVHFTVDTAAPVITAVVAAPRDVRATVTWTTDKAASSQVEYGLTKAYGSLTTLDADAVTAHSEVVTGLKPLTTYHYRVHSKDACRESVSPDQTFTTSALLVPDLSVTALTFPSVVPAGTALSVSWTVMDLGPGDANGAWTDAVYLSPTNTLNTATAMLLGTYPAPSTLPFGSQYIQSQNITVPNAAAGNYYIIIVTNSSRTLAETTMADNALAMPITVLKNQTLIAAPDQIPLTLTVNAPQSVSLSLSNLSSATVTGLTATILGASPNIHVHVNIPSSLAAQSGGTAQITVTATDDSVLSDTAVVHLTDQQGDTADDTLNLSVVPNEPNLVASPSPMSRGMTRGQTTLTEVTLTNTGDATAHSLVVAIPNAPWLALASPAAVGDLAPGASVQIVLRLSPGTVLPLGLYSGTIAVSGSDADLAVPFSFNCISNAVGALKVVAQDEFSFFASTHPNVASAHVVVTNITTNAVVVDGVTDTNGILDVATVPEGNYNVTATAEGHADYHGILMLVAGKTNEIDPFLSRELVTYEFTVVPIGVSDQYDIQITPVFATNVPAPVVTVSPKQIDLGSLQYDANGQATVDVTITNHGLIDANDTALDLPNDPDYKFTALTSQLGQLAAMTTIVVPVVVTNESLAPQTARENKLIAPKPLGAITGGVCSVPLGILHDYICGGKITVEDFIIATKPCFNPFVGTTPPPPTKTYNNDTGGGPGLNPQGGPGGESQTQGVTQYDFCDPCNRVRLVAIDDYASNEAQLELAKSIFECTGEGEFIKSVSTVLQDIAEANAKGEKYDWTSVAIDGRSASEAFKACKGLLESQAKFIATIYFACQITQVDNFLANLKTQADRLQAQDNYFLLFLGDPKWDALPVLQDSATEPLVDAYGDAADPNSDGGPMITAAERAHILAMPLPTGISAADVGEVLDRWNRTLTYYKQGVVHTSQVPAGQSIDFITADQLDSTATAAVAAADANIMDGYASILGGPDAAVQLVRTDLLNPQSAGICATVKLQLDQGVAITRTAFKASLELDNAPQSADLNSINISLQVTDGSGNDVTSLFDIGTPALTGFGGTLSGTGILPVGQNGTAQWTILPTRAAAANGTTAYYVGGQISYMENGSQITIPIFPAGITVVPDPYLKFHYFLQRDVYSDDPFTPEIEPSEPFSLGLLVDNAGQGTAHDLTITSSQPKIIDNEKGLDIAFKLIGTQVNTDPVSPSLTVDLGDIAPGGTSVADFLLTSSLAGQFVSDSASFKHTDDLGNAQTSLIDSVDTHSLEHVVRVVDPADDGKPDFLADDIPDANNLPDTLWNSDGTTEPVAALTDASIDGLVTNTNLTVHLTVPAAPAGFVYIRTDDPGQNLYQLTSVIRSDGKVIAMGDDAWTTHRTIHLQGQAPMPQNRVYLFDDNTTGDYTLTYAPLTPIKPLVALTSPQNGATFSPNTTVALAATASSTQAAVKELDFYADGALISTSTTDPFTAFYLPGVGSHTLQAVAVDVNGISSDPAQVSIMVNPLANMPPVITLAGPQSGGSLTAPATVTLSAAASDPDGNIAKVDFYSNGSFVGSSIAPPYATTLQNVPSGSYIFTSVATDNQGATTTSNGVSLDVQPPVTNTGSAILHVVSAVREAKPGQLLVTLQNIGGMNAVNVALAATRTKWGGQSPTSIVPSLVPMLAPNSTTTFTLQFPPSTTGASLNLFGTFSGRSFNSYIPVTP